MTTNLPDVAIGLDLGGTAIKGGLVARDGRVIAADTLATEADHGADHVIARMAALVGTLARRARAEGHGDDSIGVGVGVPGTLSRRDGVVIAPPNLPGWRDVPLARRVSAATGRRIVLDNDANNAALGEFLRGAGRGTRNLVMLTLGTGIGGGIIVDGRLWHGARENAGEIGHMIVQMDGRLCGCGQRGCLEAYASARATVARLIERIQAGERSVLAEAAERGDLTSEAVVQAALDGDAAARSVWEETCRYLAVACVNVQHLMSPERIILAGGMSAAGEALLASVRAALQTYGSATMGPPPDVRLAELGNDAGFIGSALSVFAAEAPGAC